MQVWSSADDKTFSFVDETPDGRNVSMSIRNMSMDMSMDTCVDMCVDMYLAVDMYVCRAMSIRNAESPRLNATPDAPKHSY